MVFTDFPRQIYPRETAQTVEKHCYQDSQINNIPKWRPKCSVTEECFNILTYCNSVDYYAITQTIIQNTHLKRKANIKIL